MTLAFLGPSTETTETVVHDVYLDSSADQEIALKIREHEAKTSKEALNDGIRL